MTRSEAAGIVLEHCEQYRMSITSGYRTEARNINVGGVKESYHLAGWAWDVVPDRPKPWDDLVGEISERLAGSGLKILEESDHLHYQPRERALMAEQDSRIPGITTTKTPERRDATPPLIGGVRDAAVGAALATVGVVVLRETGNPELAQAAKDLAAPWAMLIGAVAFGLPTMIRKKWFDWLAG